MKEQKIFKEKSKFSGKLIAAPQLPTKKHKQNTENSNWEVLITDLKLSIRN